MLIVLLIVLTLPLKTFLLLNLLPLISLFYRPNNINPKITLFFSYWILQKVSWTMDSWSIYSHTRKWDWLDRSVLATSVHHVKMVPGKEIDLLFSVKHEISKNEYCLKDATFSNFVDCFKIGLKRQLLNLTSCSECQKHNVSICGIPYMKYFLDLENDLPFCSSTTSAQWSFTRLSDLLR